MHLVWKEKIKRKEFFFPEVCLTSILQNSFILYQGAGYDGD